MIFGFLRQNLKTTSAAVALRIAWLEAGVEPRAEDVRCGTDLLLAGCALQHGHGRSPSGAPRAPASAGRTARTAAAKRPLGGREGPHVRVPPPCWCPPP